MKSPFRTEIRIVVAFLALVLSGCATSRSSRSVDPRCGRFQTELAACLGDEYDDALLERLGEVARCESGCRAKAKSPAGYVGAFQFASRTWTSICGPIFRKKGLSRCGNVSARSDLCCSATCAAEMFSRGESGHWPNCGR